eukprot:2003492-Alexandrium_andersonii.AAC.1
MAPQARRLFGRLGLPADKRPPSGHRPEARRRRACGRWRPLVRACRQALVLAGLRCGGGVAA